MFDTGTAIGIKEGFSEYGSTDNASDPDEEKELREIIAIIEAAGERLDDLIIRHEARGEDTSNLDEAADALSNAVDSLEGGSDKFDE